MTTTRFGVLMLPEAILESPEKQVERNLFIYVTQEDAQTYCGDDGLPYQLLLSR